MGLVILKYTIPPFDVYDGLHVTIQMSWGEIIRDPWQGAVNLLCLRACRVDGAAVGMKDEKTYQRLHDEIIREYMDETREL